MGKDSLIDRFKEKFNGQKSTNIQAYILDRLSKEKGFLETVFNTIREGIILIDVNLRIRYVNNAAVNLLGLPENTENLRISKFLRDIDWKRILQEDEQEWYRLSRQEIEVFYPIKRVLHFYLVPHEGSRGIATVILNDVTESRTQTLDKMESEKLHVISLLAASVAHEIGNPLNSLYLHLQLFERNLSSGDFDIEEAEKLIKTAKGEVERLDMIVSQFLRAVRPTKPKLASLDIKDIIIDTLNFLEEEVKNRDVNVKCIWPDILPRISGDINQLKQAFFNILKNAFQAMPEGGTINIKCEYNEDFVELSFADTGIGINAEDIGNIFDPYHTSKDEGTGLGLMIVERIIRDHGAELVLDSEPGKRTVFIIRFPRHGKRMRLLSAPEDDGTIRVETIKEEKALNE